MSGAGEGGGGDRWHEINVTNTDEEGRMRKTRIREDSGGYGGGGNHGESGWGKFGKAVAVAGALVGAVALGAHLTKGEQRNAGGPEISIALGATDEAKGRSAPGEGDSAAETTEATIEERPISVEGNIGQLEIEIPNTYAENERVQVTLIFDGQPGFNACEGDLNCEQTLEGVPNATTAGAFVGGFDVIVPEGEPTKRMISTAIPRTVTWNNRTVTIDPARTRVRVADEEIVPLQRVLGEVREQN